MNQPDNWHNVRPAFLSQDQVATIVFCFDRIDHIRFEQCKAMRRKTKGIVW